MDISRNFKILIGRDGRKLKFPSLCGVWQRGQLKLSRASVTLEPSDEKCLLLALSRQRFLSIEELEPVKSKITFVFTVPFIWRSRSSQLAFTLQKCVPEELLGLVSQGIVDPIHGVQFLIIVSGGDTCQSTDLGKINLLILLILGMGKVEYLGEHRLEDRAFCSITPR